MGNDPGARAGALDVARHARYFRHCLASLQEDYVALDTSRMTAVRRRPALGTAAPSPRRRARSVRSCTFAQLPSTFSAPWTAPAATVWPPGCSPTSLGRLPPRRAQMRNGRVAFAVALFSVSHLAPRARCAAHTRRPGPRREPPPRPPPRPPAGADFRPRRPAHCHDLHRPRATEHGGRRPVPRGPPRRASLGGRPRSARRQVRSLLPAPSPRASAPFLHHLP